MKAGEEGKLYGAVTTRDIAEHLEKQGLEIDRKKIDLKSPIKSLGEYDVPLKLHPEVTGTIRISVVPEGES
jgi:large subunit ribosomal protein L9